jgi:transcriptional regulator with GAF, ATPase, and Fis domain
MDPNEFHRQATLRICGNLEFDTALSASMEFLRQVMPVDRMHLQFYEPGLNAMRTVAIATHDSGRAVDVLMPMSKEAIAEMLGFVAEFKQRGSRHVWLFDEDPSAQIMTRETARFHKLDLTSIMVLPLGIEDELIGAGADKSIGAGSLLLMTEGDEKLTAQHVELVALLREPFAIALSNAIRFKEVVRLKEMLADDNRYLHDELRRLSGDNIIGADFGLSGVMRQVQQVAPTDSVVMLTGETGVGKDVVANAIHLGSKRRDGPFIPVNCGAIPDSLIDSELFGHEKGAFTGALATKRGRFERANKGTILLDEIGDMPLEAQVRLLRVLQQREVERVGGTKAIPVDIRIIAATNQDLTAMVRDGRFREDLWYRINVFPILVPPLRERTNDIPALVQHFIGTKAKELKIGDPPKLAPGAMDVLVAYDWPGNVRELQNVIERAMILYQSEPLRFDDLVSSPSKTLAESSVQSSTDILELDAMVAEHIRRVLHKTGGKISGPGGAAKLLDMNPNTLRDRMKKLGIRFKKAN